MKLYDLSAEEIEKKIEELAGQYTPEWQFDRKNPDIGTALAKLFAMQMKENVDMADRMLERYHTEFVNMLDLSQKPAKAAGSLVLFSIMDDTVPGVFVRKGTRLVADGNDGGSVYFETEKEFYATSSHISEIFMTDREDASFVPILGDFTLDPVVEGIKVLTLEEEEDLEEEEEEEAQETEALAVEETESQAIKRTIRPFVLFSESGDISRNILVIYHAFIFDILNEPVYIRITGNPDFVQKINEGQYRFSYYAGSGLKEFKSTMLLEDNETFMLMADESTRKFRTGSKEYSVVLLENVSAERIEENITGLTLSSSGKERPLDYVDDGNQELDPEHFYPFSDTLAVYNECYLGHDLYFSKAGSRITVTFKVSFAERFLYISKQEEEAALKIIKRKPKIVAADIPAEAYADVITFEYFNGTGYKRLKCFEDLSGIFSNGQAKDVSFSFICPSDWAETESGAFSGRSVRMRLMQSDNCFLRPCLHHYPIISGLKVSFEYGEFMSPHKLLMFSGTKKRDITSEAAKKKGTPFAVMSRGDYSDDALYIGFDKKINNGPVSLYFELEDVLHQKGLTCIWEYSSDKGFKRLRVLDRTSSFRKSGTVLFLPPEDMVQTELENKTRYWIKIRRLYKQKDNESNVFLPKFKRILLNVVEVVNTSTSVEENYYLSEIRPNLRTFLGEGNILEAEIWMNETGTLSREEIFSIQDENPDRVRVEYDLLGNISEVYVKWKETDSFLNTSENERRVYMIDRVSGEIIFSDGIKAEMPKVTDDISFKAKLKMTDGKSGNVDVGGITDTVDTAIYIESVTNLFRAYGGRDMETVEEALKRGANIISGRGRLVSVRDYIWEILNYSDSIAKAACLPGVSVDGTEDELIFSIILLMRDYDAGSFSFHRTAPPLKDHLLKKSALTLTSESLQIVEPIFVTISVDVWAEIEDLDENFEVQGLIKATLSSYLDPVRGNGGEGFEIGELPRPGQISMRLAALKNHAIVKKSVMTAHYVDRDGEHETELSKLKATPFMVARSGTHNVHIMTGAGEI